MGTSERPEPHQADERRPEGGAEAAAAARAEPVPPLPAARSSTGSASAVTTPVLELEPWVTAASFPPPAAAAAASDPWAVSEPPTPPLSEPLLGASEAGADLDAEEEELWDSDSGSDGISVYPESQYWESLVDEVLPAEQAVLAEAERLSRLRPPAAAGGALGGGSATTGTVPGTTQAGPASGAGALVAPDRRGANTPRSEEEEARGRRQQRWRALSRSLPLAALLFAMGALSALALSSAFGGGAAMRLAHAGGIVREAVQRPFAAAAQTVLTTPALLQVAVFVSSVLFTRQGLEPTLKWLYERWQQAEPAKRRTWDRSAVQWLILDVYRPVELVLLIATAARLFELFLVPALQLPVQPVLRATQAAISVSAIIATGRVLRSWQTRWFAELIFQAEMSGRTSAVTRIEGTSRIVSIITIVLASLLSAQAIGFDLGSLLAVGGISGLAIGLAGREILGNIFAGLMLYATQPFSPGEHIKFVTGTQRDVVDGNVVDVGLFRTTIRSFEREVYLIPNAVFSTTVLLNVTRKGREWRVEELISVRHVPMERLSQAVKDLRAVLKADERVIKALHRRVFLNRITHDGFELIVSFYVEAVNRDQYLSVREDVYYTMIQIFNRYHIQLASNARLLSLEQGGEAAAASAWAQAVATARGDGGDARKERTEQRRRSS